MMKFITLVAFLYLSIQSQGQVTDQLKKGPDRDPVQISKQNLVALQTNYLYSLYYKVISEPKEILNGKEYLFYFFQSKTNPLFYSRDKFNAILYINDRQYSNIKIQYDTYLDEVIYTDTSRIINYEFPKIALNRDIIEGFSLCINGDSLKFRHLRFPPGSVDKLENGYYEIVYDGASKYIIKHRSVLYRRESLNEYKYSPVNYVRTGGNFFDLGNKKNFVLIFGDKSQEIKTFLHKSKIRINKANKNQIVVALKYYDSLKTAGSQSK
jgi:hypothetical protein